MADRRAAARRKVLMRSRTDRRIAGVCGGLGEYFGTDPTVFRLLFAFAALGNLAAASLFYVACWALIPPVPGRDEGEMMTVFAGCILVAAGIAKLAEYLHPRIYGTLWPLGLVGAGALLVYIGAKKGGGKPG